MRSMAKGAMSAAITMARARMYTFTDANPPRLCLWSQWWEDKMMAARALFHPGQKQGQSVRRDRPSPSKIRDLPPSNFRSPQNPCASRSWPRYRSDGTV